jgi:hypothetical protein
MNKKLINILFSIAIICVLIIPPSAAMAEGDTGDGFKAPLILPGGEGHAIPDQYIVVYKPEFIVTEAEGGIRMGITSRGGEVGYVYQTALNGISARLPKKALEHVRSDPAVAYVEADQVVSLEDDGVHSKTTQTGATWGLDRIDQRNLPLNNTYVYGYTGKGVHAYIIDTGIRSTHNEFGGRAVKSFDSVGDGRNGNDCHGHGTHVAGTVGGATYGVAKNVRIHAIRVLNCAGSGSTSGVIAGIDWVRSHRIKPAVANMSLGGGPSTALDTAVNNLINHGVTVVVAAGNDYGADACNKSPARVPAAITVGSTTSGDARSSFSNIGTCLDMFAPGSSITSAWIGSDTTTNTISGTSMAAPHVAGVSARYLQYAPGLRNGEVRNALVSISSKNLLTGIGTGSPNRLLYSRFVTNVPVLVSPIGTINDRIPTFKWTKVNNATAYRYQVWQGTTKVYTKTTDAACGSDTCARTPSNMLEYNTYKWRARAKVGGVWKAWSEYKSFNIQNPRIPIPVAPKDTINDRTPTFKWTKVNNATAYRYQLWQGTIKVYTKTTGFACGTTTCRRTPSNVLEYQSYKWRVRAKVGGVWRPWSEYQSFNVDSGFETNFK